MCVSSQVGCAELPVLLDRDPGGFNRNLSTAEIIGQGVGGRAPPRQRRTSNAASPTW